ncbi:baculoviral IAP repeat-containing protein 5.1-like isoform X1 [Mauremys mutica]|uniref:baculoviral IAP repeat-containing protein 5.1-like isoform X1 n=1 Tax=Mauremys mutica TaxID=74926 RepID=UPI001D13EFCA|nr:baculoviral IAP repeat-containing protein 5.1-like isoform X1 [Mauremys mutica]
MEAFLKKLNLACKHLIEYRDMYEYENRIKTFTDWPFMENCKCSPEHTMFIKNAPKPHVQVKAELGVSVKPTKVRKKEMARAGFIHCPSANEPDVAKCFFCLIELEGWEPNDDPQVEHSKRPSNCGFLSLAKNFDDLTMEEYYMLEMDRLRTFLCKTGRSTMKFFEEEVDATRKHLIDHFVSKHQYTPEPKMPVSESPSTC